MISSSDGCCPDTGIDARLSVTRFIIADLSGSSQLNLIKAKRKLSQELIEFKSLSQRNGIYRASRASRLEFSSIETKKLGRALLSLAIPGDSDPIRSPVRSAIYRTLTPGKPGGMSGSIPTKPSRGYRCPEGYQYGGRFTDSRLSTCGAKLFDIPSPLGLALMALRRLARKPKFPDVVTNPLTAGQSPGNLIESRKPQIPKVSFINSRNANIQIKEMIKQIGQHNGKATRMVRRDGFVLEPVVPAKVLRAIPDNRDMEGATYILSALSPSDIGNDELGLLSNTGVVSLIYVMPGGSTLVLKKQRKLSIGERRKLGRTVNSSMTLNNSKDPGARLKAVARETGEGMGYFENFTGIKNPNEIINGKPRWANEAFKRKNKMPKDVNTQNISRESTSNNAVAGKINSIDKALDHLSSGGALSKISPAILADVLANSKDIKIQKLENNQSLIYYGNKKYFMHTAPRKYQHIDELFAADIQQHIGLESPDVILASGPGPERPYIREDVETAFNGAKFNPAIKFDELDPKDVAKIMISDYLTDQENRPMSSIYPMETASGPTPMLAQNILSQLMDLDKISITKRNKINLLKFYTNFTGAYYSKYYLALKLEQRVVFRKTLDAIIKRAKSASLATMRERFKKDGLSIGELQHLAILEKLFTNRLESLFGSKRSIIELLEGRTK